MLFCCLLFSFSIFFSKVSRNTIRLSNSLYPDQANSLLRLVWIQTTCKGYQQTTKVVTGRQRVNSFPYFGNQIAKNVGPDQAVHLDQFDLSPNCLPGSDDFCRLLINLTNSLDPDQDQQIVGPDLDPNCLTL